MTMLWNDIVGHQETVAILQRLVDSGRLPHAILLAGPKGIGKGLLAHTLAAAMLCQASDKKPCGLCRACHKIALNAHPDLIRFESNGENLKIEQMRDLQAAAALSPVMGGRRVVILEDAERMTVSAANSLLKILEEPSPSLAFIITAGSAQSLLSTIVSRCRVFRLAPATVGSLVNALVKAGWPADTSGVAARLSGGRLGRALALLEPDGLAARSKALTILQQLPGIHTLSGWNGIVRLDGSEADSMPDVVEQLTFLLRDILLVQCGCPTLVFNTDLVDELNAIANVWSEEGLRRALNEAMEVSRALTGNANARLLCEALLLRLEEYYAVPI